MGPRLGTALWGARCGAIARSRFGTPVPVSACRCHQKRHTRARAHTRTPVQTAPARFEAARTPPRPPARLGGSEAPLRAPPF